MRAPPRVLCVFSHTPLHVSFPAGLFARGALVQRVGPPPDHGWGEEWHALVLEEFGIRGYGQRPREDVTAADHALGAEHSIRTMEAALAQPIAWLVAAGWDAAVAGPCTLLGFCGRAALGRALAGSSRRYAACTHLIVDALQSHAATLTGAPPAPRAYRNLSGNGGLLSDDEAWAGMPTAREWVGMKARGDGYRFITASLVLAE